MPATSPLARRAALLPATLIGLLIVLGACEGSSTPSPSAAASVSASASASAAACGPEEIAQGGINGSVVDADGNPLGDIFLIIETGDGFRGTARTAEDGVFTALGVSGEFVITTVDIEYAEVTRRVTVACGKLLDVELVLTLVDG